MPFIPHTEEDIQEMLKVIRVKNVEELFDEIPSSLRAKALKAVPEGTTEMVLMREMKEKAKMGDPLCFVGAGAYEHHIPAAVWQIAGRGEYMTAYTPYQAEASQGTLQLLYEYQTMMASLMGMEVSNASLYDGASALAEAILMAVRANTAVKSGRVLVAGNLNPLYKKVVHAIVSTQDITVEEIPFDNTTGLLEKALLPAIQKDDVAALVISQPNFFGALENVDMLTDWGHEKGALVIAVVNPTAMALLKEPGQWGSTGADMVCGEGQPLGVPLASGGPYFGFLCCKMSFVRQMPGRIIGRTVDVNGHEGFTLTLQAREQHIRRSKATSNICTNQGLAVTAATVYMAILGEEGLRNVAKASHENTRELLKLLSDIPGVKIKFPSTPYFHEAVIQLPKAAKQVCAELTKRGIIAGYDLTKDFPDLKDCVVVCATETKLPEDLARYKEELAAILHATNNTLSYAE